MDQVIKRSVGINISKSTFTACVCQKHKGGHLQFSSVGLFNNDNTGYNRFIRWVRKTGKHLTEVNFLMEATGVYYESLACHLDKLNLIVNVVLPNTSKHYFSSLNIKSKTDQLDAKVLSQFAVERRHKQWSRPNPIYLELRSLTRFYVQLQETKTQLNNQKHSKEASEFTHSFIVNLNRKHIKHIDMQIQKVKDRIKLVCKSDSQLWNKIEKLMSIKGVGLISVATIVGETLGFEQVKNRKQLASYAGYDVVHRESGSSIKGKTRISKKGNRYIRNSLFFPAMVACRYNPELKKCYLRIIKKKESKMIGQVAIQRKLLLLMYALWKKDEYYQSDYQKKSSSNKTIEATQDSNFTSLELQI
jgi:transposase